MRYQDLGNGWTARVPAGWTSVELGPTFVRGEPLADPTRLLVRTYRDAEPAAALRELSRSDGIAATTREADRSLGLLRWHRYHGRTTAAPKLPVELAVAKDGTTTYVVALTARPGELGRLVERALLPALDSFAAGRLAPGTSVLATPAPDPAYWPTAGWRSASPGSQGMDGRQLGAMLAEIRAAKLPVDSVTVVRHGYVVLDATFGPFASGRLGAPFAAGPLHDLQSATKSVTSMLLGIALHDGAASGVTAATPLVTLAARAHYAPEHTDARKRAVTLEDLLTMQSGFAWRESGYAYEPGTGNDVMGMLATSNWTSYVVDRPTAAQPGTTFVYDTGTAHLVSAAVSLLTGRPAVVLAAGRLFGPLGIGDYRWPRSPEGITPGGFGLLMQPRDLAKLAFLYLHGGRWDGRQIVPADWVAQSTTDHVADPLHEYGYLWWLDHSDGYAYMAGLYGQLAVVVPGKDLVAVFTAHFPASANANMVNRWLLERYVLPAAD